LPLALAGIPDVVARYDLAEGSMVRGQDVAAQRGFGAAAGTRDQDGAADVAAMEADFPEFAIWREYAGERVQYIARRMRREVHPHTIVTSDPAELRACLATRPR
jgi:hypothetical protein